jgi:hypothetical protein
VEVTCLVTPLCVCVEKYGATVDISMHTTREINLASYRELALLIEAR